MRGVPVGGAALVLAAVFHGAHRRGVRAKLPREAGDEPRAFHVPAEKAEPVGDPFRQQRVLRGGQMHRLDEAGDADDRIAAWGGADLLQHLGLETVLDLRPGQKALGRQSFGHDHLVPVEQQVKVIDGVDLDVIVEITRLA